MIVELDNVLHGEVSRARTMLTRLFDQIRENKLESRVEILVMYDETAIHPKEVQRIVPAKTTGESLSAQIVPTKGLRYYSLKNEGGRLAKGEMTLEAWVYPTAAQSGWRAIVQKEVDAYSDARSDVASAPPFGA